MRRLTLNNSKWPESRDARRKARAVNNVNDGFDILVSVWSLFSKPLSSQGLNYDTAGLQFLLNFLRGDTLFRRRPAQYAARAMTRGAESFAQGGLLTQEEV